jgi:hypothetical protein
MTPVKPPEDDAGARVVWLRRGEGSYHDKRHGMLPPIWANRDFARTCTGIRFACDRETV